MPSSTEKRISKLREQLDHHNHLYHVLAKPKISDREYDRLMQELIDLEKANPQFSSVDSPTQRVGGDVQTELKSVRHAVPMMSIDNTYSEEELRGWERRVHDLTGRKDVDYVCELKLDGMSLALIYEDGRLARGVVG